jgi:hypothetical protein
VGGQMRSGGRRWDSSPISVRRNKSAPVALDGAAPRGSWRRRGVDRRGRPTNRNAEARDLAANLAAFWD